MNVKSMALASAAAALFVAGGATSADASHHEAKIKCEGVNQCKGQSECKTAHSECKGMNSCKGKGYLKLTKAECDAAKAAAKE